MGKVKNIGALWNKARETTANDIGFGDAVPVETGSYKMQLVGHAIIDGKQGRTVVTNWCTIDDEEWAGTVCTSFDGIYDAERLVWFQRLLIRLGVDLDDVTFETEDDIVEILQDAVEEFAVCKVRVVESGDYVNLKIGARVEVSEDDLYDPIEIMNARASGDDTSSDSSDSSDTTAAASGEDEWKEGDDVQFLDAKGKQLQGVIQSFDENDVATVHVKGKRSACRVAYDDLAEPDAPSDDDASSDEEDAVLKVGSRVKVEYDGAWFDGEITSLPPNAKAARIQFDDGDEDSVEIGDIVLVIADVDDANDADAEDDGEVSVGDVVIVEHAGKEIAGEVTKVDGDDVWVKLPRVRKAVKYTLEDVAFEIDD